MMLDRQYCVVVVRVREGGTERSGRICVVPLWRDRVQSSFTTFEGGATDSWWGVHWSCGPLLAFSILKPGVIGGLAKGPTK